MFTRYLMLMLLSVFISACDKQDRKSMLFNRLEQLETAIESKDSKRVLAVLKDNFVLSKQQQNVSVHALMRYYFNLPTSIEVQRTNETYHFQGDFADVKSDVVFLRIKNLLPRRGQQYIVESRWYFEDEQWQLIKLRWRRED